MKVVALAGGVGGAKLVDGLAKILPGESLTIIVNTADDFDHFGLRICPDLDTVCYTLAGIANPKTGWGQEGETWQAMETVDQLGGPTWFRLGDRDLGTHMERTRLLKEGKVLSEICHNFSTKWEIAARVLPMSDDRVATVVHSSEGDLPFQDYFVKYHCEPQVSGFYFEGVDSATPAPGVLESLLAADLVVICPSNPWVSIDPILAVTDIPGAMIENVEGKCVIAVSPIIQGKTVKGPAAKMFLEMGISPSAANVAVHYGSISSGGLLSGFILDTLDEDQQNAIHKLGISSLVRNTLMKTPTDRINLAEQVIEFGELLLRDHKSVLS
ncbi:MAG: 2-phospho-L-lactate transferase [Anaerolineales bacterium]